jgi:hypothetical protein
VRREWIKLYLSDWLDDGFTSFLSPAQMGVAAKLWALAGRMKDQGIIRKRPGVPFTLAELSLRLKFRQVLVKGTLAKLEDYGFIITDRTGIHWTHWDEDQPVYNPVASRRQLPPDHKPPEELSSERLVKQAELDSKLPKRELIKLSSQRQQAAQAYKDDPDKFIKGKYGHMVRR